MDRGKPTDNKAIQHPRENKLSEDEKALKIRRNALLFTEPFSIVADQFIRVETENLAPYFKNLRLSMLEEIRGSPGAANTITENVFVAVCRYLTACRVSRVYCIFCGFDENPTLIPSGFELPESLANRINRIGVVAVQGGAYRICPQPEHSPTSKTLVDNIELSMLNEFASFNKFVKYHGRLYRSRRTSTLAESIEGSSWWFMTARSVTDPNMVAKNESRVIVRASHKEWAKLDRAYCAEIRNQFDGRIPVEKELKYTHGPANIVGLMDGTPRPSFGHQYVEVKTGNMSAYFAALRRFLLAAVQPYWGTEEADTISEADFISICRWVIARRVKHVYETFRNDQPPTRSSLSWIISLPKGFCEIVNKIGVVSVHDGGYKVCPKPERDLPNLEEPSNQKQTLFSLLVDSARKCGFIRTDTVSNDLNGSSWWLLTARSVVNQDIIASQSDTVVVYGSHKEWTVLDGLYCALVQNQYDGILPIEKTLKWCFGTYSDIPALLSLQNLPAEVRQLSNLL